MLTHHSIARFSLALLCLLQGGTTVLIDLGRTHASNPAWTAHARFHVVWQTMTVALLAVIELILIFAPWPLERQRFFLASMLALLPMIGFFAAFIGRSRYGGTLGDQRHGANGPQGTRQRAES
ncbi:MAG TPA: hypothetical protein VL967_04460 [Terracidiphilus sp.]|nr:hypothetical protein [Terracidiphilus sp.]